MAASCDGELIQIVDAALAEAARKSGAWLLCRPGCSQCCLGPFAITALDAHRLQQGFERLAARDPERARRIRTRAIESVARLWPGFPRDSRTGLLPPGADSSALFTDSAGDEPCPALDPDTGACDLYQARPLTCRLFGPPIQGVSEELGVCELCFEGATEQEIADCAVELDIADLEAGLIEELGEAGETIVAFCLAAA